MEHKRRDSPSPATDRRREGSGAHRSRAKPGHTFRDREVGGFCSRRAVASSYESTVAINLKTGAQLTVGSNATSCQRLWNPTWSGNGSQLVVHYGSCESPLRTTGSLAIVRPGSSWQFSRNSPIKPSAGCGYGSAIFDSDGILAVEGCAEASPARVYLTHSATPIWCSSITAAKSRADHDASLRLIQAVPTATINRGEQPSIPRHGESRPAGVPDVEPRPVVYDGLDPLAPACSLRHHSVTQTR